MYDTAYTLNMKHVGLWKTKVRERQTMLREIRKTLMEQLTKNKLGFGYLSHGDIAVVLGTSQASVSRIMKTGKNISKPINIL